ncbi:MAG: T9SS type A sorting domain-containing protein [Ferruginibacter sp.]
MKKNVKNYGSSVKALFFAGMFFSAASSYAQRPSVTVDAKLGQIAITDAMGSVVDANNITAASVIKMRIPVLNDNHGKAIPKGSSKIKIGLGSKLELDPSFNMNSAELNGYFAWSKEENGGQIQITGDLVNDLPASVTAVDVFFKVRATMQGTSTITANFLVTNHNGAVILSDEDGGNNASALSYRVTDKVIAVLAGEAAGVFLYPNPVSNQNFVTVQAKDGAFTGRYNLVLFDGAGKQVQTTSVELSAVNNFRYKFGNIAAGKYFINLNKADNSKQTVLHFEKF